MNNPKLFGEGINKIFFYIFNVGEVGRERFETGVSIRNKELMEMDDHQSSYARNNDNGCCNCLDISKRRQRQAKEELQSQILN